MLRQLLGRGSSGDAIMMLKNILASSLVIALGLVLIVHFSLFWIHGGVFIHEESKIVLALETLMSVGILCFGIERFIGFSRGK